MKIVLTCCIGMSTSMLAELMSQASNAHGFNDDITCIDSEKLEVIDLDADVLLLGPQIKHMYRRLYRRYHTKMPVAMIDAQDYGCMNGENVLKFAHKIFDDYHGRGNYLPFDEKIADEN